MSLNRKTLAVVLSALMVFGVAAPAVAGTAAAANASLSVDVTQDSSGVTVSVTETENNNTSAVENATVDVEVLDENKSYADAGTYETDENGTVSLSNPSETVNVSVTATDDNRTASVNVTLTPVEEDDGNETTAFGDRVSNFVHDLQSNNNSTDAPLGALVAEFVLENNPGNPPAHAGPPAWLLNDSVNRTTGPPAHAGPPDNSSGGPPDNKSAGPPDHAGDGGPPDHAGPPGDDDNSTNSTDG